MATLTIPHAFVAGTAALASEVNANFQAVVSWTQGQIGTDNLGILGARSVALPSPPTLAILSLAQTSSNIALNISNTGTESAVAISQSGALASGKGAILINSPSTQTTSGAAEILMTLATNSTIPALLVKHGAVETLSATKDEVDLFASAVEISAARLKLPVRTTTQRNAITQEGSILYNTTLKNIAFYNGVSWAPPVLVDNSTIEYSSEVARIKDLGVTTAKLADNAVTTIKITDLNVTTTKINDGAVTYIKRSAPNTNSVDLTNVNAVGGNIVLGTVTLTTAAANSSILVTVFPHMSNGYASSNANAYLVFSLTGPGGYSVQYYYGTGINILTSASYIFDCVAAGTYSLQVEYVTSGSVLRIQQNLRVKVIEYR